MVGDNARRPAVLAPDPVHHGEGGSGTDLAVLCEPRASREQAQVLITESTVGPFVPRLPG